MLPKKEITKKVDRNAPATPYWRSTTPEYLPTVAHQPEIKVGLPNVPAAAAPHGTSPAEVPDPLWGPASRTAK